MFGLGKFYDRTPFDSYFVRCLFQRPISSSSHHELTLCFISLSPLHDSAISRYFCQHGGNYIVAVSHCTGIFKRIFRLFSLFGYDPGCAFKFLVELLSSCTSHHSLCCTCVVLSSCSRCCVIAAGSLHHRCLSLFVYIFLDLFQHVVQEGPGRGK